MAYANVTYTGDGANKEFQIPFEYLNQTHLTVTRDAVADTNGVEYSINTSTQKVVYVTAPATDVAVKIQRVTPIATEDRPVDFEGGSGLGEDDLDSVALSSVFLAQEAKDDEDDALVLKADVSYVDAQVAANSVTDQAYTDTVVAANSVTDQAYTDALDAINSAGDRAYADALDVANSITDQAYTDSVVAAIGAGDTISPATNTDGKIPIWNGANSKTLEDGLTLDTDTSLTANSDTTVASQKATKAYTDDQIAAIPTPVSKKSIYHTSGAKTIATGTYTTLDYDTSDYDPDTLVTTGASWAWTCDTTGQYLVNATATFNDNLDGYSTILRLNVDTGSGGVSTLKSNGTGHRNYMSVSGMLNLTSGDVVDVEIFQNSGINRSTDSGIDTSTFSIALI